MAVQLVWVVALACAKVKKKKKTYRYATFVKDLGYYAGTEYVRFSPAILK